MIGHAWFAAVYLISAVGGSLMSLAINPHNLVGIGASGGAWPMDPSIAIKSYFMPQGVSADLIATKYGFSRDDVDEYAVTSQQRAAKAWDEKRFANSVITMRDVNGLPLLANDEHMRPSTNMQSLASLKPSFVQMGELGGFDAVAIQAHPEVEYVNHVHHAGNSSGIVDGAAAVLVGNKDAGDKAGLKPRARIRAFANIGSDPALMLTGPIDVTRKVLRKAGMTLADLVRLNAYVSSADYLGGYMKVRDEFVGSPPPASTLMVVQGFARPQLKVEIEAVAARAG